MLKNKLTKQKHQHYAVHVLSVTVALGQYSVVIATLCLLRGAELELSRPSFCRQLVEVDPGIPWGWGGAQNCPVCLPLHLCGWQCNTCNCFTKKETILFLPFETYLRVVAVEFENCHLTKHLSAICWSSISPIPALNTLKKQFAIGACARTTIYGCLSVLFDTGLLKNVL